MERIKITKIKIRDFELPYESISEFIDNWKKQGHEVISYKDDWLVLKDRMGHESNCIVLGNSIFPFNFEG